MIPAIGRVGVAFLDKLYKGKSFIGKKTKESVTFLGNKGYAKSARALDIAATKGNKAIKWTDKTARKYPKSTAALGGAVAWDIVDND